MDSDEEEDLDLKEIPNVIKKIPNSFHAAHFEARPMVLDIMRKTNVQKDLEALEEHCKTMDQVMSSVVNTYYQGFNKSIRSYSQILSYITDSQVKVDSLKVDLEKAKALLICRNQELKIMWKKVLEYHYMLQILEKIEDLETVPQKLEVYIAENHFLHASEMLVKSVKTIFGEDLIKVGALAELRRNLLEQRNTFHEVLIDKLHHIMYVKDSNIHLSLQTEDISSPVITQRAKSLTVRLESDPRKLLERATSKADFSAKMDSENFDEEAVEDLTTDPSQNTKHFMRLLVEGLNVLGPLNSAISIINSKISPEMKKVIHAITGKVLKAHENKSTNTEVIVEKVPLLVDLTNMIFDKCIRIMTNHIQSATMFNGVFARKNKALIQAAPDGRKDSISTTGNYNVEHVWEVVQKEIREMLKGYLGDSQTGGTVLANGGSLAPESDKKLFTFANSSASLQDTRSNVPSVSLLHNSPIKPSPYNITVIYPAVIKFDDQVTRLMGTHVKGYFAHLQQQQQQGSKSVLRNYIDDFIQRAFLQHIKTDYSKRVQNSIEGPEAFKCISKAIERDSSRPLLHSIIDVFQLIRELVVDVTAMPQYASDFITIMESILSRYFDKCLAKMDMELKDVLTGNLLANNEYVTTLTSDPLWKAIKTFSHKHRRSSLTGSTASGGGSSHGGIEESEEDWSHQEEEEYAMEAAAFYAQQGTPIQGQPVSAVTRSQLITELPKLALFASISDSLDWLAARLCDVTREVSSSHVPGLGHKPNRNTRQSTRPRSGPLNTSGALDRYTLTASTNGMNAGGLGNSALLPSAANAAVVEALDRVNQNLEVIAKRFNTLADRALLVLRSEFRLHCLYYLEGLKRTSYVVEESRQEPDGFISELNASLSSAEETMVHHLPPIKTHFLFDRLAALIARLLVKGLASIRGINKNGVFKMFRNVFALQQNLTNIIARKEQHFDRVRKYYDLLNLTEEEFQTHLAESISNPSSSSGIHSKHDTKRSMFSADEYRAVVEVQKYNKRISAGVAAAIEQKLKMHV